MLKKGLYMLLGASLISIVFLASSSSQQEEEKVEIPEAVEYPKEDFSSDTAYKV